jgi:hypothetical protein
MFFARIFAVASASGVWQVRRGPRLWLVDIESQMKARCDRPNSPPAGPGAGLEDVGCACVMLVGPVPFLSPLDGVVSWRVPVAAF